MEELEKTRPAGEMNEGALEDVSGGEGSSLAWCQGCGDPFPAKVLSGGYCPLCRLDGKKGKGEPDFPTHGLNPQKPKIVNRFELFDHKL